MPRLPHLEVRTFSEAFQVGNSWTNYGKNYCLQNAQDRFCAAEKAAAAVLPRERERVECRVAGGLERVTG